MPPPTTRTSKVRAVNPSRSRCIKRRSYPRDIIIRVATIDEVRTYWERHIHDLEITQHPVGSRGFFEDLDQYHFEKLHHLLRLVPLEQSAGEAVVSSGFGARQARA